MLSLSSQCFALELAVAPYLPSLQKILLVPVERESKGGGQTLSLVEMAHHGTAVAEETHPCVQSATSPDLTHVRRTKTSDTDLS